MERLWSSRPAPLLAFAVVEARNSAPLRAPWGVAALLLAAGDALAARFGAVAVRGEISGFVRAASGHCYFSLKDSEGAAAVLRCAMFRRAALLLDFQPADGQQVELRGRIGVYESRGELQLVVEAMGRVGAGTLYEEFLRLRARLEAAGLFDSARKRPIARFPAAIGVVTSLGAAALRDVLTALARRAPQVRVVLYPSPVQGAEAPLALVAALQAAGRRAEVDTLLLVRGGGALEDLWAFNDERVVRAITNSPIPVVCGVGHETDVTLSDLAADLRAATPTAAAELAAPAAAEQLARIDAAEALLRRSLQRTLQRQAQRIDTLVLRLGQPVRTLAGQGERLAGLQRRLLLALRQRHSLQARHLQQQAERWSRALHAQQVAQQQRLVLSAQRLSALDPKQVLQRGYAWVEALDGRPVLSVRALRGGQAVRAVWADGRATAEVLSVEPLSDSST
jgi:exodeoxyribonuclease VII large subunit